MLGTWFVVDFLQFSASLSQSVSWRVRRGGFLLDTISCSIFDGDRRVQKGVVKVDWFAQLLTPRSGSPYLQQRKTFINGNVA
ncbi:hypothetical protein CEXT_111711, partial [Caerostris extrusa]